MVQLIPEQAPKLIDAQPYYIDRNVQVATAHTANMGLQLADLGAAFEEQAKKSSQSTALNTALTDATVNYSKAIQDRNSKLVDDKGNPTYGALVGDVQKIGDSVSKTALKNVNDYEVASAFSQRFQSVIADRTLQAQGDARKQQIDFEVTKYNQNRDKLLQSTIEGPASALAANEALQKSATLDAEKHGYINAWQAAAYDKEFSTTARMEQMRYQLAATPEQTANYINKARGSEIGVDEQHMDQLRKEATAALNGLQKDNELAQAKLDAHNQMQQKIKTTEFEDQLDQGHVKSADITATANDIQFQGETKQEQDDARQLWITTETKKYNSYQQKSIDEQTSNAHIASSFVKGVVPFGVSEKQINNYYQAEVKSQANPKTGEPPSFAQQAVLTRNYTMAVTDYSGPLSTTIKFGDPEKAVEATKAGIATMANNPVVLDKMKPEDKALMYNIADFLTNSTTSPTEAVRLSRNAVEDSKIEDRQKEIQGQYKKDFKDPDSEIKDALGMKHKIGTNDIFGVGVKDDMESMLKTMYYNSGGNKSATLKQFSDTVAPLFGTTKFGSESHWYGDVERTMMLPPEVVYPGVPFDKLKSDFDKTAAPYLPGDAEAVMPRSDILTRQQYPTYGVWYKDKNGNEKPLLDEHKVPIRWYFDLGAGHREEAAKAAQDYIKRSKLDPNTARMLQNATDNVN